MPDQPDLELSVDDPDIIDCPEFVLVRFRYGTYLTDEPFRLKHPYRRIRQSFLCDVPELIQHSAWYGDQIHAFRSRNRYRIDPTDFDDT